MYIYYILYILYMVYCIWYIIYIYTHTHTHTNIMIYYIIVYTVAADLMVQQLSVLFSPQEPPEAAPTECGGSGAEGLRSIKASDFRMGQKLRASECFRMLQTINFGSRETQQNPKLSKQLLEPRQLQVSLVLEGCW